MASTYLSRTPSGAGSRTTWTFSAWIKRTTSSTGHQIFDCSPTSGTDESKIYIYNDFLYWKQEISNTADGYLVTNRKFRDTNAWYHIVCQWNTTNATASERMKIWINGVQETSFSTNNLPDQNRESYINSANTHYIGTNSNTDGSFFNGSMSHIHFIDGTAYDATAFGSTDSTTGEWKINTSPSVTYGTNGFFILKNGNSVTDQSGNGNNFTVGGGTLTKTEDCPSNVFATLNAIQESPSNNSLSNGNTTSTNDGSASGHKLRVATLGASSGKWYMEAKLPNGGSNYAWCGIISYDDFNNPDTYMGSSQNSISYGSGGTIIRNDSTLSSQGEFSAIGSSTILQVAVDLDNNYIYFGIDGTYVNSGDPTSGGSGTGGYSINFSAGKTYTFGVSGNNTGATWNCNFGNGYFGTTAVSSAGTNASGNGIFEYDVPTGFTALSTKGLNL